jgi:hypothetical protein
VILVFLLSFLSFLTIESAQQFYNGVIELNIRPYYDDINNDLKKNACNINKHNCYLTDKEPWIVREEDLPITDGDGFGIYQKRDIATTCDDINYCMAKKVLKKTIAGVDGVFAYYKGQAEMSDSAGSISFPCLEAEETIPIAITEELIPISVSNNTPIKFIAANPLETAWYECKGKSIKGDGFTEWSINKSESNLKGEIPENALIIISDPNQITFEKDPLIIAKSSNIIVPTLYASSGFTKGIYALYAMDVFNYYSPLNFTKKKSSFNNDLHFAMKS